MSLKNSKIKSKNSNTKSRQSLLENIQKFWPLYVMVLPGTIFIILFRFVPLFGSIIAFQNYSVTKGIFGSTWVGLKNFQDLIKYPDFQRVFFNTLILGGLRIIFTFPAPVLLALMINEVTKNYLKKPIQTILYIPHFLSWVVVAGITFDIMGMGGIFNNLRAAFGLEPILLMQNEAFFRPIYVITAIWKETGWGTVVYLAALTAIDPSLYESAMIDGANKLRQIIHITLPLLMPTVITLFLLNIGSFIDLGFDQVYNLITPMTYNVGDIFDTYVFRVGILQARYSYTTAVGLFQSVIGFVLVFTFNKIANKVSNGEGGLW
jgi:putative aldouronate transport system permease protein